MCIEPRPVSSCCPPTLTPFSLPSYIYTRATIRTYTTRGKGVVESVYAVAYTCIRMPDLPQRESHCAAGECLLFSRVRVSARPPPYSRERGARWWGEKRGGRQGSGGDRAAWWGRVASAWGWSRRRSGVRPFERGEVHAFQVGNPPATCTPR